MPDGRTFQRGELTTTEWTSGQGAVERVVVLCHGFGASGTDLVGLGEALGDVLPTTRWIFPAAPLEPPDMAAWGGRAWWPLRLSEMAQDLASAGGDIASVMEKLATQVPDGLESAGTALCEAISLAREPYDGVPLILGGFSQGAMLTANVTGMAAIEPDALICFSGCPIASGGWSRVGGRSIPAMVSHGRFDPVLPFVGGEMLSSRLQDEVGCCVEFVPFDGAHEIPIDAMRAAASLIANGPV